MNNIRLLRKEMGLSMRDLGKMVDAGESTISQYETGKRQPDPDMLIKLADFFNVTIDYLLGRDSEQKNNPDAAGTGDEIYTILKQLSPENREKILELSQLYLANQQPPEKT